MLKVRMQREKQQAGGPEERFQLVVPAPLHRVRRVSCVVCSDAMTDAINIVA